MATGPNQILLKRSDSPGVEPSGLSFGEPAVNVSDGVLFFDKQTNGTVDSNYFWKFHGTTNESIVTSVSGVTGAVNAVTSVGVSGGTICTNTKAVAFTSNTTGLTFETTCHGNTAHVTLNAEALRSFTPEAIYNYSIVSGALNSPTATANGDFIFNPDNNKVSIFKRTAFGIDYRDFLSNVASNGIGSIKFFSVSSQQQDVNEIFFDQVTYDGDSFDFTAYQTFPNGVTGASGDQVSVSFHPVEQRIAASSHFETPDGSTFGTVVTSFNGKTGAVNSNVLHLHAAGLSTDGGLTLAGVLQLVTGSSVSGVISSNDGVSVGGSTIGGVNIGSNAINASGVVTASFFSGTATAALSANSATTATTATNVSVTATNDSTNYRVPFAAGSASGTIALGMKSDSGTTHEGLFFQPDIATLSTGIVNPTGISLGSAGITFTDGTTMSTAFTNTLKGKLDAIEASADVTDATNVTSAGALMDSELTSIADVKALDQSVVSGASPTFGTANFTDASNKRLMTDAQESKLDGVEASADVTDTANVTSAGALMDSELTSIADVKALDQSVVSGANPVFTFISALAGISVGAGGITFSDGTQTTTAIRTDSYTGQIETAADKTYTLDPKVATARTVTGFYIKSASGTVTATLKNGSDTIKAASVSSSSGDQSSLANTSVSADAVLTLVTSSNSSALDVIFNVEYTAAL